MNLGDTFLMSVPPNFDRDHLFIVISDPTMHQGTFIIVNLTTDQFRAGNECILAVGDHPWITKQCFVTFADAIEITPQHLQTIQAFVGSRITLQPPVSPAVLAKIIDAAKQSKAIPRAFKKYL